MKKIDMTYGKINKMRDFEAYNCFSEWEYPFSHLKYLKILRCLAKVYDSVTLKVELAETF